MAAEWAGFTTIGQCEIDDYCTQLLGQNFPGVPRWRDIRDVTRESVSARGIGRIDLLSGGIPCQPHSVAGKRGGSSDERDLWSEFARLIRELRPRWALVENVPGLLSSDSGRFFGRILRDLAEMGYDASWCVYGANAVGANNKRERLFIVAYRNDRGPQKRRTKGIESMGRCGRTGEATQFNISEAEKSSIDVANPQRPERWPGESSGYEPNGENAGREKAAGWVGASGKNGGEEFMAYPKGDGCRPRRTEPEGQQGEICTAGCGSPHVADTAIIRCEGVCEITRGDGEKQEKRRLSESSGGSTRPTKSRLGGMLGRSADWLDCHRWPAGPGEPQYDWEPPRIARGVKNRVQRLKALGNICMPQQVYPILQAIADIIERGEGIKI
jgi:DNA (cytosine-5)-methyltransferase 1